MRSSSIIFLVLIDESKSELIFDHSLQNLWSYVKARRCLSVAVKVGSLTRVGSDDELEGEKSIEVVSDIPLLKSTRVSKL